MLSLDQAKQALSLRENNMEITKAGVADLLVKVRGTTFAHLVHVTDVTLAAASRNAGEEFVKISSVTGAQLFNNVRDARNVYEAAVKRSAERLGLTAQDKVDDFEAQSNWFSHFDDCYSVVHHKEHTEQHYLYFIAGSNCKAEVTYYDVKRGKVVERSVVEQHLTPSGLRAMNKPAVVENSSGVTHDVVVRVVKLENVLGMRAMGYELDVVPTKRTPKP